jgi:beta-galactosidase
VPPGDYELTLHFAELLSKNTGNDIAFNVGSRGGPRDEFKARSFDVLINGQVVVSGLSNSETLQTDQAVAIKCLVSVAGQEGVQVTFKSRIGEAVLNGVQLRKLR